MKKLKKLELNKVDVANLSVNAMEKLRGGYDQWNSEATVAACTCDGMTWTWSGCCPTSGLCPTVTTPC